jgi:hypothetical protein
MKTLLSYPGIGTIVKVPIQAKMDVDDEDLTCFHFGSSQEYEIDPPLVLDSVWDCSGITLDTFVDDDGKTIPGWRCSFALFPAIVVVLDSSSTLMHLRHCCTLQREGHCHFFWLAEDFSKCCSCLNLIDVFKGK